MNHAIQPRPGFEWSAVTWGAPDQPRTDRCSYCGDPFPDEFESDFVPLIMWNNEGWCAEFCDHCQATWFGIETFPPDACVEPERLAIPLGTCCICETGENVHSILMLPQAQPDAGSRLGLRRLPAAQRRRLRCAVRRVF